MKLKSRQGPVDHVDPEKAPVGFHTLRTLR